MGKDLSRLDLDDLQPVDEFHIRGSAATYELIELADFSKTMHVLDLGCGIGGSSRRLAFEAECKVTGVDLSEEYIVTANKLTQLLNMQDQLAFYVASALSLPFADQTFDGAWSIQMHMNIEDKRMVEAELFRVLKPGAKLVLYEVCAGEHAPVFFPVPWAQDASMSFLLGADTYRQLVQDCGFVVKSWTDKTDLAIAAFANAVEPDLNQKLPLLGVHMLVGDDILTKAYNLGRSFREGRTRLIEAVVVRP